jgi:branched-chain amino acid transport system substrate-binding protein
MNRRTLVIGAIAVVVIALIVGGVVYFTRPGGAQEIKIGALYSQTGPVAPLAKKALEGLQLAVDEINAQGGINGKKIQLIVEDAKSNPTDAVSAFQKLITVDRVPVVLGPLSSSLALACAPIANREKVILFSTGAGASAFSSPRDYTFRNWMTIPLIVKKIAGIAYQKLGLRKMAILYVNNDIGNDHRKNFVKYFTDLGGEIISEEAFEQGATDMRAQLTKIKEKAPDGIYLLAQAAEGGHALKQMKELSINAKVLSAVGIENQEVINIAGEAANGVIYTLPAYNPNDPDPRVQSYEKKFEARYGKPSDAFAATAYDAMYILKWAIEKGGYSADGIKNALFQVKDFPGVSGSTSFDENGDVIKPVQIKMIKEGKFIFLDENLQPVQ